MNSITRKNGGYSVSKNDMVALEGEKPASLMLLVQGTLDVFISPSPDKFPAVFDDLQKKSYRLFQLNQNIFIGANDILQSRKNSLSIAAATDCSLFFYRADNTQSAWSIIHEQKDYGSYMINSNCNLICSSYQALKKASAFCMKVNNIYNNLTAFYMTLVEEYNLEAIPGKLTEDGSSRLAFLKNNSKPIPLHFSKQFIETETSENQGASEFFASSGASEFFASSGASEFSEFNSAFSFMPETQERILYFIHMYRLPVELRKTFFAADYYITASHITDASRCLEQILLKLRQSLHDLEEKIDLLYSENKVNVYKAFLKAANEMYARGLDSSSALEASSYIYGKLREISAYIELEYWHQTGLDFNYLEYSHINSIAALEARNTDSDTLPNIANTINNTQSFPEELINSTVKILEYSEISEDKAIFFMMNLTAFRNLRDKLSNDDTSKNIRKSVADVFFDIYRAVFKKARLLNDNSRLIKMFLSYGYMDEKILNSDQVLAIYKLAGIKDETSGSNVHYMYEWFTKIFDMEKEPSINHFGQDYYDVFRALKKRGKASDADKIAYDNDKDGRLAFEIDNMFQTNHKLCQGQLSTYFPILHSDMAPYNPIRSNVTPALIKEKLGKLLDTDYSAFYREINYRESSKGIEKELVMMSVIPDFILMPVYGSRAIMWQEIAGRVRSTPGRFLLPVFTDENLDDMLIKLVGNFRWELCRTMMGSAWNDITHSSLTSEYTDYVQFYRKNRDLSDEAKERLKALIAKHHNKMRDIFTSDYEQWINYESKGNPRLNKVARNMLFRHCPFSKGIREQLEKQPMYSDMITLLKKQKEKQVRDLDIRYKYYRKVNNGTLDTILEGNLEFYRDL